MTCYIDSLNWLFLMVGSFVGFVCLRVCLMDGLGFSQLFRLGWQFSFRVLLMVLAVENERGCWKLAVYKFSCEKFVGCHVYGNCVCLCFCADRNFPFQKRSQNNLIIMKRTEAKRTVRHVVFYVGFLKYVNSSAQTNT
jgi:hypothetical protein